MVAPTNFPKEELPKGGRNFHPGERGTCQPQLSCTRILQGKPPFAHERCSLGNLVGATIQSFLPQGKSFFPLKKLFIEATWLEFPRFFSLRTTSLNIPSFFLLGQLGWIFQIHFSPKQLGQGYWLVSFSHKKVTPQGQLA